MTDTDHAGTDAFRTAMTRWKGKTHKLEIPRADLWLIMLACQLGVTHPAIGPGVVKQWEIIGREIMELICDDPEIYALASAGWMRQCDVGIPQPQQEEPADTRAEEQPEPPADATAADMHCAICGKGPHLPHQVDPNHRFVKRTPLPVRPVDGPGCTPAAVPVNHQDDMPAGPPEDLAHPYQYPGPGRPDCAVCGQLPGAPVHEDRPPEVTAGPASPHQQAPAEEPAVWTYLLDQDGVRKTVNRQEGDPGRVLIVERPGEPGVCDAYVLQERQDSIRVALYAWLAWGTPEDVMHTVADALKAPALDVTQPYAYLVERLDQDPPRMLSYGTQMEPLAHVTSVHDIVTEQAARSRCLHTYEGPIRVSVWPHRGDREHYRQLPPDGSYRVDLDPSTVATALDTLRDRGLLREDDGQDDDA